MELHIALKLAVSGKTCERRALLKRNPRALIKTGVVKAVLITDGFIMDRNI